MNIPAREIEFKFAVSGAHAFELLAKQLELPESVLHGSVLQTNHFFDSSFHCLHGRHCVIRLRQQAERNILTIKGERSPSQAGNSVLSDRIEEEVTLSPVSAEDLLQGKLSPRRAISEHFEGRSSNLLNMIESVCAGQELVYIGEFSNRRIHLPVVTLQAGKASEQIVFELDTSTFPDGSVEHEIEVEISAHSDATAIEAALVELLQQAGIEWQAAPSKAARFFKALGR